MNVSRGSSSWGEEQGRDKVVKSKLNKEIFLEAYSRRRWAHGFSDQEKRDCRVPSSTTSAGNSR